MAEFPTTTEATFQQDVLDNPLPVLVDFTAAWCQPCKRLEPIIHQLIEDWDGKVEIRKVDVDDYPQIADNYQVMGVPTLMLFKAGKPVERVTGYQPKDRLENKFGPFLS